MSEVVIVSTITAVSTLVAALGGTSLANRHTRRLARESRRQRLDEEARRLVVEVLGAAKQWRDAAMAFGLALSASGTAEKAQKYLAVAGESAVVDEMARSIKLFSHASISAKLLLEPSALRQHLEELQHRVQIFHVQVSQPILDGFKASDAVGLSGLKVAFRFYDEFDEYLVALEKVAAQHFRS